jgi:hypothetical protein
VGVARPVGRVGGIGAEDRGQVWEVGGGGAG